MENAADNLIALDTESDIFSPINIFLHADMTVKLVMLLLFAMSIWSWAVIFERTLYVRRINRRAGSFERRMNRSKDLRQLHDSVRRRRGSPMINLFVTAMGIARSMEGNAKSDIFHRIEQRVPVTMARDLLPMSKGLSSLATIGAISPFVGLFGTVWGIMNSFQSIAITQETSLAAVAPGIAEALFATALGLFVAIPAVVFFNRLNASFGQFAERVDIFANEVILTVNEKVVSQPAPTPEAAPAE